MSLSDRETLELRVKALEEELEKTKDEVAGRAGERKATLRELIDERDEMKKVRDALSLEVGELETELLTEVERRNQVMEATKRAKAHALEVGGG